MGKILNIAYMSGGGSHTLYPFYSLLKSKHKLRIVCTKKSFISGRSKKKFNNLLLDEANHNNITCITPDNFKEADNISQFKKLNLDLVVVFSYGVLLPKNFLSIPKYGCINIHTSLLPKWRGASPVQQVLMHNEKESGFTFILMNERLDEGDIIYKKKILVCQDDNYITLLNKITKLASNDIVNVIERLADNNIKLTKQNNEEATYCYKIKKEDSYINFNETAQEVYGKIRAFNPNPGAKCFINGELVKILEASLENSNNKCGKYGEVIDNELQVACKFGSIKFTKIQRQGKRAMTTSEVLNGWKVEKGIILNAR